MGLGKHYLNTFTLALYFYILVIVLLGGAFMLTKAQKLAKKKLTDVLQDPTQLGTQRDTLNALVYKGEAMKEGNKYRRKV